MDGDAGPEQHGCVHYRRGCKIRAPCCGEVFGCRHCHNEAKDSLEVSVHDRHVLPRHDIKLVICSLCNKEQDVSSLTKQGQCSSATVGVTCHTPHEKKNPSRLSTGAARLCELRSMSRQILLREMQLLRRRCKLSPPFFDVLSEVADGILRANLDVISEVFPLLFSPVLLSRSLAFQVSKNQFHCDGCGICRTGGAENFYHCGRCGCCYTTTLKDSHRCVDGAMHHNCPVCMEYLFDSMKAISVLHCGHTIHLECLYEMRAHQQFSCPVCLRSACNMSDIWQKLDQQVAASPMPAIYQKKMVWILCNDCGVTSNVQFHILAHKCPGCSSYNTRQTRGDPAACSRV
ncbi:E3 ubiquitin-protein ligase RZFP34 isoform X1 [Zea mays]|uniref:CHY-type/CTCHY-type/RING-type Zinc finger protein n=2 Tax=Zea mays TaxID=4577 RepID=A0A804LDK2_MAIZE|nr:uncharacterized protein LOC100192089 isoform X1 [Zea mays]XP_008676553.1 uncharacterized protein LOC100192089 isoform X1 [Zea mays]|eukprot:XP_008676511.1 uncharacterized protein LOC100192089 isoform X1 [Zea mays]